MDTPGAYPGIDAEERGQSEAIGRNIFEMARWKCRSSTIIGEGGSGGALAISVGDQVLMFAWLFDLLGHQPGLRLDSLEDLDKAQEAAEALGICASTQGPRRGGQGRGRTRGRRPP